MNNKKLGFSGFKSDAAKRSLLLSNILINIISKVESDIKLVTSTPKHKRNRMEISFSKYCDNSVKYKHNFQLTMDCDSGYISHNHESNSDSSLENLTEMIETTISTKPIYLNEDALLEKPEASVNLKNLSFEIEKEDYEETRNLFNSPDIVIPSSVTSQETDYSVLENDLDSNTSVEIPIIEQIVVKASSIDTNVEPCSEVDSTHNCCITESEYVDTLNTLENEKAENISVDGIKQMVENDNSNGSSKLSEYVENNTFQNTHLTKKDNECSNFSTLSNITNVCNTTLTENSHKKRLTLIFSKCTKENMYSVKRKYRSVTPDKSVSPEKSCLTPNNESIPQEVGMVLDEMKNGKEDENSEREVLRSSTSQSMAIIQETLVSENRANTNFVEDVVLENLSKENMNFKLNLLSATPEKKYESFVDPNVSPDLFGDEEPIKETISSLSYIAEERYIIKKDHKILKRVQNSLKGVLPPFSITVLHLSVDEMLNRLESNTEYFWTNCSTKVDGCEKNVGNLNTSSESSIGDEFKSLLITGTLEDCIDQYVDKPWSKSFLEKRYHGLQYNRSKLSEEFEELCAKYGQRYVGAETQSTCTVFETNIMSPMKRKQLKQRWAVKSPGRRLSHLARRRITFSSANLQAGTSSMAGSRARQILVDARKLDLLRRKSPRRSPRKSPRKTPKKTPGKSPRLKNRTPSSSAKKKLAIRFRELTGEIEKTGTSSNKLVLSSKRALFPSPGLDKKANLFLPSTSGESTFKNDLKNPNPKRALFISPNKKSPLKRSPYKRSPFRRLELGIEKKRKRSESDDIHPPKLSRSISMDIRASQCEVKSNFSRTTSDMSISLNRSLSGHSGELSDLHKKKLQWAVYEALRSQNITPTHAQFKIFASILARVTRRFLPNLTNNAPRPEGSTSERMLRIARHHVYAVVKGKSVDEIISEYLRTRSKNVKPQGYIGIEEFTNEKRKEMAHNKENVVQCKINTIASLEKKKLVQLGMPKPGSENRIERIRKVINFGDDNR